MMIRNLALVAMFGLTACGNGADTKAATQAAPVRVATVETAGMNENRLVELMLGHAIVPAVGAFVLALPLLIAIRRSERSQRS